MNNSTLFKQAHKMTKLTIQNGDNYQATFGVCLKLIKADIKQSTVNNINFAILVTAIIFIVNTIDNLNFAVTMIKILGLVLAAPLSIVAAIVIDYNISF